MFRRLELLIAESLDKCENPVPSVGSKCSDLEIATNQTLFQHSLAINYFDSKSEYYYFTGDDESQKEKIQNYKHINNKVIKIIIIQIIIGEVVKVYRYVYD